MEANSNLNKEKNKKRNINPQGIPIISMTSSNRNKFSQIRFRIWGGQYRTNPYNSDDNNNNSF